MNVQLSTVATEHVQGIESLFEDFPDLKTFFGSMDEAQAKLENAMKNSESLSGGSHLAHAWKCLVEFGRDFEVAKRTLGLGDTGEPSLEQEFLSKFDRRTPRALPLGEQRAIRVAVAYQSGFRPGFVGAKDTPMEAALQVAAYIEGLSLETGPETIRKSIQRFRKSIAGEEMFKFDRDTMDWKVHKAEDVLLDGLPKRSGRPKRLRDQFTEHE